MKRGNILFIILLAVVLFAALAYAVTSSLRGGGKSANDEQAQSYAAELIQYGTLVQNTINRLMLTNDCKDTDISFENVLSPGYVNPSAPAKCKLFDQSGGGLSFKALPAKYLNPNQSTYYDYGFPVVCDQQAIDGAGLQSAASSSVGKDLVMLVPYLTDNVCLEMNKALGVKSIPDNTAGLRIMDDDFNRHFKGSYWSTNGGWAVPPLVQTNAGCMKTNINANGTTVTTNVAYFLLLAR